MRKLFWFGAALGLAYVGYLAFEPKIRQMLLKRLEVKLEAELQGLGGSMPEFGEQIVFCDQGAQLYQCTEEFPGDVTAQENLREHAQGCRQCDIVLFAKRYESALEEQDQLFEQAEFCDDGKELIAKTEESPDDSNVQQVFEVHIELCSQCEVAQLARAAKAAQGVDEEIPQAGEE